LGFGGKKIMANLIVKSPVFKNNYPIPKKYSCDGDEVNPPLNIEGIPKETKTLTLTMEDPDAPRGTFDHWVVWNIAPTAIIEENKNPGIVGLNSAGESSYIGMCPPSGTHRYFFKVCALDTELHLKPRSTKKDVEKAMQGHILAKAELVGLYQR
jgi:Raf kinase inhibitor-like YbhB/YbcL family protein